MRRCPALALVLILAAGPARADDDTITPIGVKARQARAEIVGGAIISALAAVAAVVAIATLAVGLSGCSANHDDCAGPWAPISLMSGLAAAVETVVGIPLLTHGLLLRGRTRLLIAPTAGPNTVGGGLTVRF